MKKLMIIMVIALSFTSCTTVRINEIAIVPVQDPELGWSRANYYLYGFLDFPMGPYNNYVTQTVNRLPRVTISREVGQANPRIIINYRDIASELVPGKCKEDAKYNLEMLIYYIQTGKHKSFDEKN